MGTLQIATTAAILLVATFFFWKVGRAVQYKGYAPTSRGAGMAYATWWHMVALMTLTDALRVLTGLSQDPSEPLYVALAQLKIIATAVALWGLGGYVVFVWTGHRHALWWAGILAAAHGTLFLILFHHRLPVEVVAGDWAPRLVLLGTPVDLGLLAGLGAALFFFPPLALTLALVGLLPRIGKASGQRRRLAIIVVTLLVFHVASILLWDPNRGLTGAGVPILSTIIAAAGLSAYQAYRSHRSERSARPGVPATGPL